MTGMRSRRAWNLALAVAVCASASLSSSAGAALIGPKDISDDASNGVFVGGTPPCTYSNVQLPEGNVRSPFSGDIERWRVNVTEPHDLLVNDGPLRLQVLKRTTNEPGVVNDEFKSVRQTGEQSVTPGGDRQAFNTSLRIREGQFIGLDVATDTEVESLDVEPAEPAYLFRWCPWLTPGAPGVAPSSTFEDSYLFFNATVRR